MRPAAPAPKPKYVYQEYPKTLYPSTALLAKGLHRTKVANSEAEESAIVKEGYQATQAAPPVVEHTATKEEALAKQQAQFDAAWDKKVSELAGVRAELGNLQTYMANLQSDRDMLAKRLATVTEKIAAEKKAAKTEPATAGA